MVRGALDEFGEVQKESKCEWTIANKLSPMKRAMQTNREQGEKNAEKDGIERATGRNGGA